MKTLLLSLLAAVMIMPNAPGAPQFAQTAAGLGENAALRYWSAFAQMQDVALTDAQAKDLKQILDGTAPFVDSTYRNLIERNRAALETMARGTELPYCNWGIDYALGPNAPVDYIRKALQLGRLNVLYALHLGMNDRDAAVRALAAGVRFSHDVANGGTLFSALVAKNLLAAHLRTMAFLVHVGNLNAEQRKTLKAALTQIGPDGLDWQAAVKRELDIYRVPFTTPEGVQKLDPQAVAVLSRITMLYVSALKNPSALTELQKTITGAPAPLPHLIPNPKRVIEEKQALTHELSRARAMLR
jgi:hypothetical protein